MFPPTSVKVSYTYFRYKLYSDEREEARTEASMKGVKPIQMHITEV
jgi:hypothetical protein